MGKPWRDPELAVVCGTEPGSHPAAECRRTAADVHGDVEHFTLGYAHQFPLRVVDLVVQPTEHAAL